MTHFSHNIAGKIYFTCSMGTFRRKEFKDLFYVSVSYYGRDYSNENYKFMEKNEREKITVDPSYYSL
jgi:hypothetical protein